MLFDKINDDFIIKFNKNFYDIDSIIASNTKFEKEFDNQVSFSFLNNNPNKYHIVKLTPKKKSGLYKEVYDYINDVLKNEDLVSNK